MIHIINKSHEIPMNPFNFEFLEDEIVVYQHDLTSIFDLALNLKFSVPIYSNGSRNFVKKLPNGEYAISDKIFSSNGIQTNKKYKVSKKSLQKYTPKKFIDFENKQVIGSYGKAGIVVIYNQELEPIDEIQLGKFEVVTHLAQKHNNIFTFDRKLGLLIVYSYPSFEKINEFKVNKQNNQFKFSSNGKLIFNYGYTSTNQLIDLEKGKMRKIMFHPTNQPGYKEQYKTPHNFGVSFVQANETFSHLVVTTDQNKIVLYDIKEDKQYDLKLHEHFNFDKFYYPSGKYPFGEVIFEKDRFMANVKTDLTFWNYTGEMILKKENITFFKKHPNGRYFSLIENRLTELEIF